MTLTDMDTFMTDADKQTKTKKLTVLDLSLDEPSDGKPASLLRQCKANFVLGEDVDRKPAELAICKIATQLSNIHEVSLGGPEYKHQTTDDRFYRPSYWYHEVTVFWARPLRGDYEERAMVEEESRKDLEAAVDLIADKYELVPQES